MSGLRTPATISLRARRVRDVPVLFAITTRPNTLALALAIGVAVLGWLALRRAIWAAAPPRPAPSGDARPRPARNGWMEPPAVVALLTNDYTVPPTAVTATVLDLASRGWIQLAHAGNEVVVFTRGSGNEGDVLRPFEQQVLNHLAAQTFDGVTSAATLAAAQHRMSRRWWRRFRAGVVATARGYGLTRGRYGPEQLAPPAFAAVLALALLAVAWRTGDDQISTADSLAPRLVWIITLAIAVALAVDTVRVYRSAAELPTDDGLRRAAKWLGYRARLLARIPERASIVAPPEQQRALADACVMGVAEHVVEQLSVAADDDRLAWSDAGGTPHIVRVRYPTRPAYGRQPIVVTIVGVVVLMASLVAVEMLGRVADGELLESLVDRFPEHDDLVANVAEILAVLMFVPIAWSIWAIVAGVVDTVSVTERVGVVVRARRPVDVTRFLHGLRPLADRDRYSVFLAVDDGTRRTITAWVADERTAAPQGAQARVRATPLLGHVRKSEPIGTATRRDQRLPR
jgi:Predicted membrane protein (DUF2207)